MRRSRNLAIRLGLAAIPAFLVLPFTALGGTGMAAAAPVAPAAGATVCTGTPTAPGTLAGGTYASVEVKGVCAVDGGQAVVTGNVTLDANTGLFAVFAKNAHGAGTSGLTVNGTILVGTGATLLLGCDAKSQPCVDDNQNAPTLNGPAHVGGSILATNPLGVVVHDTTITHDAIQSGGGGGAFSGPGAGCTPTGIFASLVQSPVFSNYEDNTIGGNLWVTGLQTCWFGAFRNQVGGSITVAHNTMADPDGNEVLTNHIRGNLICTGNSPRPSTATPRACPTWSAVSAVSAPSQPRLPTPLRFPPAPGPSECGRPRRPPLAHRLASQGVIRLQPGRSRWGRVQLWAAVLRVRRRYCRDPALRRGRQRPGRSGLLAGQRHRPGGPLRAQRPDLGSAASLVLHQPVVGIAAAPGGNGYWEVAGDGGVFGFGPAAPFFGSAGTVHLAKPVVGMAPVPTGNGYDLVATDGGISPTVPAAVFHGSLGGIHLNGPIVGMAIDPATGGYSSTASAKACGGRPAVSGQIPALAITMSRCPNSATPRSIAADRAARSRTSAIAVIARCPSFSTSRAVSSRSSGRASGYSLVSMSAHRSTAMMSAPSAASIRACDRP